MDEILWNWKHCINTYNGYVLLLQPKMQYTVASLSTLKMIFVTDVEILYIGKFWALFVQICVNKDHSPLSNMNKPAVPVLSHPFVKLL